MKRMIVITATVILALASCRKDGSVISADMKDAIGFSPRVEEVSTKAQAANITASNFKEFKVMSYLHGTATGYFDSVQTATGQTLGYFTTEKTYYWPAGSKLDFFAYSGSGAGLITNTGGVASLVYTAPGDDDFIVAVAENCSEDTATEESGMQVLSLTFSHVLTKVEQVTLKAKEDGLVNTDSYKFLVTDVSIAGAKNRGTYTFNPASGVSHWKGISGDVIYTFTDSGDFLGGTAKILKDGSVNDQFIILPQTATFSITYSVQYSSDGGVNWTEAMSSTTKTVDVKMEMGKAYDITFVLSNRSSSVTTNVSIDSWMTSSQYLRHDTI